MISDKAFYKKKNIFVAQLYRNLSIKQQLLFLIKNQLCHFKCIQRPLDGDHVVPFQRIRFALSTSHSIVA